MPEKILIVRLGAIGDVANALVCANAIKRSAPNSKVGWAVHPLSAPLVEDHPAVDRVHVWPRGKGLSGFRALVRELRAARYDTTLDLQRLQKSGLVARLSGASRVIGFDRARSKELSWIWTKERIDPGPAREHMVLQYMRFVKALGLPSESPIRDLPRHSKAVRFAVEFVARHGAPILLNLGASKPEKHWPVEFFRAAAVEIIEGRVQNASGPVVLTGGPGDRAAAEFVGRDLDVVDLVGGTSLPELWELCRLSRAMVTGDTGPMHLCAAVGTPTVAVFGPGDPSRTGPFGKAHIVLQGDERIPRESTVSHTAIRRSVPMAATSVSAVMNALSVAISGDERTDRTS